MGVTVLTCTAPVTGALTGDSEDVEVPDGCASGGRFCQTILLPPLAAAFSRRALGEEVTGAGVPLMRSPCGDPTGADAVEAPMAPPTRVLVGTEESPARCFALGVSEGEALEVGSGVLALGFAPTPSSR